MSDLLTLPDESQARALVLLADTPSGMPEGLLLAHGVTIDDMVALVQAGYATAHAERIRASDKVIVVATVRITDKGREAIRVGAAPCQRPLDGISGAK
jgi:predicted methyltransferase MtxX (methanogen marker protein 4)